MSEITLGILAMPDDLFWSQDVMARAQNNAARKDIVNEIFRLRARVAELATQRDELIEALTSSAETKAAYIGEFNFNIDEVDENGNEVSREITVPWTTIKEIMAAILSRAVIEKVEGGK